VGPVKKAIMSMSSPQDLGDMTTPQDWLSRIASVQRDRSTPEQLEQLRRKRDSMQRAKVWAKKANRMGQSLSLSSTACYTGMLSATATPAPSAERAVVAMASLSSPVFLSPSPSLALGDRARSLVEEEAEEDALEEALVSAAQEQVAQGSLTSEQVTAQIAGGDAAQQAQQTSLQAALAQLEKEPTDPKACEANFKLYEGISRLTEDARSATLELWEQSKDEFDAAPEAKAELQRMITRVDKQENLGIHDDPRYWFVHGMCQATARNQTVLNGVLSSIKTRLELLSSQTECPICYEDFGPDRPSTTLSCAHKACTECWGNWSQVCGGRMAVCPICRNEEFLERVLTAADAAGR